MPSEMKHERIAYIIPFQKINEKDRDPVLLIDSKKSDAVNFDISIFFVGLRPGDVYSLSCLVRPDDECIEYPNYLINKKFRVDDVLQLGDRSPTAFEVPIVLQPPISSGTYRIEVTLSKEGDAAPEAKRAVAFVDIKTECHL